MMRRSFTTAALALATVACSDAATSPRASSDRSPTSNLTVDGAQGTVFGPERFERSTSAPVRVFRTVSGAALASVDGPFTLRVVNGPSGTARASSAVVTVDGVAVVRASDLAPNVAALERVIEAKPGSEIGVELRGAPGSAIELTIRGVPKPESAPVLLTPVANARIVQNDRTTGCPASLTYGYGFRIDFSWSPATGPQAITGYEITVGYPGAYPILSGLVDGTSYTFIGCGFVRTVFLDGWQWRVLARYADGTVGPSSATGTFGFTPMPAPPEVLAFVQTPPSYAGAATRVSVSGAVDASTSSSVRLTAVLDVPVNSTGTPPYPFVEFFWINGQTRQKIGNTGSPVQMQTPTSRTWIYTFTWAPPAGTPIGTLSVVAVRTDFGGSTFETPATLVTVVP